MSILTINSNLKHEASASRLPYFQPGPNTHAARSSIAHPQLRDLLICPTQAHHVQTVSGYGIDAHVFGKYTMRLMDSATSFLPNCLVSGCGYVASGGGAADLLIRSADVQSRWELKIITGQSIVNSVHFFQPSKRHNPQILVCNNDQTITQYDLSNVSSIQDAALGSLSADPGHRSTRGIPAREENHLRGDEENPSDHPISTSDEKPVLTHKSSIFLPVPVNHCSVSPDSKSMVAVGDSNEVFLYDCQSTRQSNEPLIRDWRLGPRKITLPGVSPHIGSFSTSWNQHGDKFAVASEGEVVVVYDMKMLNKPLLVKRSFQRGRPGGARVVKFSPAGPNELLAFTEHQLYVHVLDARTFDPDHEELLKVPTPIPGMTTFPDRIERSTLRAHRSTTNSTGPASRLDRPNLTYDENESSSSSTRIAELNAQLTRGSILGNSRSTARERMEFEEEEDDNGEFEPIRGMSFEDAAFQMARTRSPDPALSDRIWGEIHDEIQQASNEDNQESSLARRGNHLSGSGSRGGLLPRTGGWTVRSRLSNVDDDEACLEIEGESGSSQTRPINSSSRSTSTGARLGWGTPPGSSFLSNRQAQMNGSSIRVLSSVETERNSSSRIESNSNLPSTLTSVGFTQHRAPSSSTIASIHSRLINHRLGRNSAILHQTEVWGDEASSNTTTTATNAIIGAGLRSLNPLSALIPFTSVGVRSGMWDDLIGLSWSPDGHWLVSGTEVGLVEWKVKSSSRSAFGDTRLC